MWRKFFSENVITINSGQNNTMRGPEMSFLRCLIFSIITPQLNLSTWNFSVCAAATKKTWSLIKLIKKVHSENLRELFFPFAYLRRGQSIARTSTIFLSLLTITNDFTSNAKANLSLRRRIFEVFPFSFWFYCVRFK